MIEPQPFIVQNQGVLRRLFRDPKSPSHLAVFVSADAQLQVRQGAAQGQQRKAVVRDISSVAEQSMTTLSVPIWFNGWRRCNVVRHVMQLLERFRQTLSSDFTN